MEGGHGLVTWGVDGDGGGMNRAGGGGYEAAGWPLGGGLRNIVYFQCFKASSGENMRLLRATAQCWKPAGEHGVIL